MDNKEFYIGWQAEAPKGIAKLVKRVVWFLLISGLILAMTMGFLQKKFSTANFEFGQLTEVEGTYFESPLPMIKVLSRKDILNHQSMVTIPLVGFGKFGTDGIIKSYEKQTGKTLNGKTIRLKGTLLYNDGKLLMQIDSNDHPFLPPENKDENKISGLEEDLGTVTLKGEIVDPKCYFGVMKPGQGKPHKDCAIRCILGGIPPVLRTRNENGETHYFLLANKGGKKIAEMVRDHVAEPVSITARATRSDDWIILYPESETWIKNISMRSLYKKDESSIDCGKLCQATSSSVDISEIQ